MILWAAQDGFLSCAEKGAEKPRCKALADAGLPIPLPEIDADQYLIEAAEAVGWCQFGSAGLVPLTAQELSAWCAGTGEALTQWEFATLLRMSRAYVNGSYAKVAPYQPMIVRMALATASFSGGR